ncbi:MAG: penicillin-binding protein [Erysipelotrichaceae bacterium]|nr:penicillin-binding protein [Erysipelotrichaceae bacterium]
MTKKIFKGTLIFTIIIIVSYMITIILYPIPNVNHPYETKIVSVEDKLLYSKIKEKDGRYINLSNISEAFITTLIEVEDQHFYSHNGVDYKRIIASSITNIKEGKIVEGASTITQQLSRMIYLNNDKTLLRKFKELLISKKFEANYKKEKILEMYINLVYFGHDLYGIEAASTYYFNKLPAYLDYNESAILVGIINSPNNYAPDINLDKCISKKNQILSTLYSRQILDDENYNYFKNITPTFTFNNNLSHTYSYYDDAINKELKNINIDVEKNEKLGLEITSYLDLNIQNTIHSIVSSYSKDITNEEVAVVVMKPNSGKVIGLIGGVNYSKSQFNRAIDSKRQIGSTIKPLIYYLGLEKGMTPTTLLTSKETTFHIEGFEDYSPKNAGDKYANRKINMIEAIGLSDNIYATKTSIYVGLNNLIALLKKFQVDNIVSSPSLALGTVEMSPLELASIYNTFASKGIYYTPTLIKQVKDSYSTRLYSSSNNGKRILNETNTIIMNYLLQSPFDKALGSYANPSLVNYQTKARFSAKTGTTDSSSWVVGFNPKYTICVYVGTDDNESLKNTNISKNIFLEIANSLCPKIDTDFFNIPNSCESFTLNNKINNLSTLDYIKKRK